MKIGKWILPLAAAIIFVACGNETEEKAVVKQTPVELQEVDNVLRGFSPAPQSFTTSGKKKSVITGARGTIIHIDPSKLETIDGSPIGNNIDVNVVELSNRLNMMLNGVSTMADQELLEAGGAFYVKMWSKGIELKVQAEGAVAVELPTWVGSGMSMYYGDNNGVGQTILETSGTKLEEKSIADPEKPVNPEDTKKQEEISKQEYNVYLLAMQDYKREMERIAVAKQTFKAIPLSSLGWVVAAAPGKEDSDKGTIEITIKKQEGLTRARFFVVSKESTSVLAANYWKEEDDVLTIENLPVGKHMVIIGVAIIEGRTFVFQEAIKTTKGLQLRAELKYVTQEEVRRAISFAS